MEAIEIEAEIDENNEIHIKLPEAHGPGHARVIVLLEIQHEKPAAPRKHKPSPLLTNKGAELHGDDIAPVFSPQEWGELYQ